MRGHGKERDRERPGGDQMEQVGSLRGLQLVVANIAGARATRAGWGVAMDETQDLGSVKYAGF